VEPPPGRAMCGIGCRPTPLNSLLGGEDLARRTTVADAEIAANKRPSRLQPGAQRRDRTRRRTTLITLALVDAALHARRPVSRVPPGARLNSETAGAMIDRLSILALKIHAMCAQTERGDVDDAHRAASRFKLERLLQQRRTSPAASTRCLRRCRRPRLFQGLPPVQDVQRPALQPGARAGTPGHLNGVRLLIVKTSSMGDVVHALPVVSDIRQRHPDAVIDWLVEAPLPPSAAAPRRAARVADGLAQVAQPVVPRRHLAGHARAPQRTRCGSVMSSCSTCRPAEERDVGRARPTRRWPATTRQHPRAAGGLGLSAYRGGGRDQHAVQRCRQLAAAHLGYAVPTQPPDFGIVVRKGDGATRRLRGADPQRQPAGKAVARASLGGRRPRLLECGWTRSCCGASRRADAGRAHRRRLRRRCAALPEGRRDAAVLAGARQVVGLDTGFTHLAARWTPDPGIYCDTSGARRHHRPGTVASIGARAGARGADVMALLEAQLAS